MVTKEKLELVELRRKKDFMTAKVFYSKKIPIHCELKDGTFYNGFIEEEPMADFFIIEDRKNGKVLVFYIELSRPIQEYKGEWK